MIGRFVVASLLLCFGGQSHAQSADVLMEASAAPSSNLVVGQEILVTTVVRNQGPSTSQNLTVTVAGQPLEPFVFDILGSETVGCQVDSLDIDPVRFNYIWMISSVAAGAQASCTVRLRVRRVPDAFTTSLSASVSANTLDPTPSNNTVALGFTFGSAQALRIPVVSWWSGLVLTLGVLLLVSLSRKGNAP